MFTKTNMIIAGSMGQSRATVQTDGQDLVQSVCGRVGRSRGVRSGRHVPIQPELGASRGGRRLSAGQIVDQHGVDEQPRRARAGRRRRLRRSGRVCAVLRVCRQNLLSRDNQRCHRR
jgi:hypothetical protein